jgi:Sulfotransferase domain/N-terminal domain of galactosyltransferase
MVCFVTTCKNRVDHLHQTLYVNLCDNPNSRFVVLDYHSDDELLELLRCFDEEIAARRLTVYSYLGWPKFRMAHAKNLAHRLGIIEGGDILVNLDSDNFAGANFESFAETFCKQDSFLWSRMVKGDMARGISGRIAVPSKAFLKLGGYDERYNEWGPDDKDFNLRLRAAGYKAIEIERQYLGAVSHNDKIRFKEYPHLDEQGEFSVTEGSIKKTVVNEGRVGCGTVYRNFDRDDVVEVRPIPTRVFGIGLPKTGTCSLNDAFKILGFDSWHWSSAHAAKAIWQEMQAGERSPTLEGFEALSDLPIPVLYRKLDTAYPGAKFVLTIRNEQKWLNSIRRHFMPEHNVWRAGWDKDAFSHRAHHLAYGRCDFDETTFLTRYRQHNAEIQEYFRWRPNDLLVLNLDKNTGWQKLCNFLDKPIPSGAFPWKNKS